MKRIRFILTIFLIIFASTACRKTHPLCEEADSFSELMSVPEGFPPVPVPADNVFTLPRWELGKKLFYDPVLSVDSSLSCGSCHHLELAFSDDQAFSPGVENRPGVRNASPLINLAYQPYFLREGSVPTLEMQILVPIQEQNEFAHNIVDIAEQLQKDSTYVRMSAEAYGRKPDAFVITRAIAVFERSLISGNSPYDQWERQGCKTALTSSQIRGKDLFFSEKTQCFQCHGGLNLTNYAFENNGLYTEYADPGRMRLTRDSADLARFKVPTLRNVALTAPYMHDGSFLTLEEVIDHYNRGGEHHPNKSELIHPLLLTSKEKSDLLRFLESFTDLEFVTNGLFAE